MSGQELRFSATSSKDGGTFKLLELPPDLCKAIESGAPINLTIKGQANEDAVLCTSDKTYNLRSVVLSNSVLVVTRPPIGSMEDGDAIVIRDQLNEIIELVPTVPKLHKLTSLLKGLEYEGHEDVDMDTGDDEEDRPKKRRKFSYEDAQREIQASEGELAAAIREKHILVLKGQLRPISPTYLTTLLELILNSLISHGLSHAAASVHELENALAEDHEISQEVSSQVISWFGVVENHQWKMDVNAVVKEIGLGILRNHKDDSISEEDFLSQWAKAVGDTFESATKLSLLTGNYLSTETPTVPTLTYFPSSTLPLDPAARFSDLFLTRPKWLASDIAPFLAECTVDSKERDKLLLKYARAMNEDGKVVYTARAKYNG